MYGEALEPLDEGVLGECLLFDDGGHHGLPSMGG
jgi:hypothetical protein